MQNINRYNLKRILIFGKSVPLIIFNIKNWFSFLLSYYSLWTGIIFLRSGIKLELVDSLDASSLNVIFFKKEYGEVKRGDIVIDIGANRGYFSVYASSLGAKVYAYEPIKECYEVLKRNNKMNGLDIECYNIGIAKDDSIKTFYLNSPISTSFVRQNSAEVETRKVKCVSLEKVIDKFGKIDLIKCDIEGAEYEILLNTPNLNKVGNIRLEYHEVDGYSLDDIKSKLTNFKVIKEFASPENKNEGIVWFQRNIITEEK